MRLAALLPLLFIALSGCTDDGGPEATDAVDADDALPVDPQAEATDAAPTEPVLEAAPVSLDGNLGTWFYACEMQVSQSCHRNAVGSAESDILLERPGASLVGAALTLEWSATSAATDTLGIGLMRMGDNSTLVKNVEGTSPLVLEASDLDLLLDDDNLVHVYVYNARGFVHQPPVVGYATVDQPFTVQGTLTMRAPADGTAGP